MYLYSVQILAKCKSVVVKLVVSNSAGTINRNNRLIGRFGPDYD